MEGLFEELTELCGSDEATSKEVESKILELEATCSDWKSIKVFPSPLQQAIKSGRTDFIRSLSGRGISLDEPMRADPNPKSIYRESPLDYSLYCGKVDSLKTLLELGANPLEIRREIFEQDYKSVLFDYIVVRGNEELMKGTPIWERMFHSYEIDGVYLHIFGKHPTLLQTMIRLALSEELQEHDWCKILYQRLRYTMWDCTTFLRVTRKGQTASVSSLADDLDELASTERADPKELIDVLSRWICKRHTVEENINHIIAKGSYLNLCALINDVNITFNEVYGVTLDTLPHCAAREGNYALLKHVLEGPVNIHQKLESAVGWCKLTYIGILFQHHPEILDRLMREGFICSSEDRSGMLLQVAVSNSRFDLIFAALSVEEKSSTFQRYLQESLSLSAKKEEVNFHEICLLMESGADWSLVPDGEKCNLFVRAVEQNEQHLCSLMCRNDQNVLRTFSAKEMSALYLAARFKRYELVIELLQLVEQITFVKSNLLDPSSQYFWNFIPDGEENQIALAILTSFKVDTDNEEALNKSFLGAARQGNEILFGALLVTRPNLLAYTDPVNSQNLIFYCHPCLYGPLLRKYRLNYWRPNNDGYYFPHYLDEEKERFLLHQMTSGNFHDVGKNKNLLHIVIIEKNIKLFDAAVDNKCFDVNAVDDSGRTALHYAVDTEDRHVVIKLLSVTGIKINSQDSDGNTPLHLAVKTSNIAYDLLAKGCDFCRLKDKEGLTFLNLSHRSKKITLDWLKSNLHNNDKVSELANNWKLLRDVVNSLDDDVLKVVLQRISDSSKDESSEIGKDWIKEKGSRVLTNIVRNRRFDKNILAGSYVIILELLIYANGYDKERIQEYCYFKFEDDMRLSIYEDAVNMLPKRLDGSFLFQKALKSFNLVLLLIRIVDYLTDVGLIVSYRNWEGLMSENHINSTACSDSRVKKNSLACTLYDLGQTPFWTLLSILLFSRVCHPIFVLLNKSARQYLIRMAWGCCSNCCGKKSWRFVVGWILAFLGQPFTSLYWSFRAQKEYELLTYNKTRNSDPTETITAEQQRSNCLNRGEKNIQAMCENLTLIHHKSCMVIACTEHSMQPLLQLPILLLLLLIQGTELHSKGFRNWTSYTALYYKICSSVLGLSFTFTFFYFSKHSKVEQRDLTILRNINYFVVYFLAVTFQCSSRMFAFVALSFYLSIISNVNILYALAIPMVVHFVIVFIALCIWTFNKDSRYTRTSMAAKKKLLFCLNTSVKSIFVFTEVQFDDKKAVFWENSSDDDQMEMSPMSTDDPAETDPMVPPFNEENSPKEAPNSRHLHITVDVIIFLGNIICALVGLAIKDNTYFWWAFAIIVGSGVVGLSIKVAFYLFVQPWHGLQKDRTMYITTFGAVWFLISITISALLCHYVSMFFIAVFAVMALIALLCSFHVKWEKPITMCEDEMFHIAQHSNAVKT